MNQWLGGGIERAYGYAARQNGQGLWLYKRPQLRFLLFNDEDPSMKWKWSDVALLAFNFCSRVLFVLNMAENSLK